jgi:hypothetical protein
MENTKILIAQVNIIESGKVSQKQHLNFQKLGMIDMEKVMGMEIITKFGVIKYL